MYYTYNPNWVYYKLLKLRYHDTHIIIIIYHTINMAESKDNKINITISEKEQVLPATSTTVKVRIDGVEYFGYTYDDIERKLLSDIVNGKHNDYKIEEVDDEYKQLKINYKSYEVDKIAIIRVFKPRPVVEYHVTEPSLIDKDEVKEIMKTMCFNVEKKPTNYYDSYITLKYKGNKFTCELFRHNDESFETLEKILQDIKSGKYTDYALTNVTKIERGGCGGIWFEAIELTLPYKEHTVSKSFRLNFERQTSFCVIL